MRFFGIYKRGRDKPPSAIMGRLKKNGQHLPEPINHYKRFYEIELRGAFLDDYILGPSESKEAKTAIPWSKVVYPSLEMIFISTMTSKRIILQGTTISHTYLQSFLAWTMLLGKENLDPIFKSSLFSSSPQFLREFSWTKTLSAKQSNQLTFKGCCIVTLPRNHTN